jgi:hypothetical protein
VIFAAEHLVSGLHHARQITHETVYPDASGMVTHSKLLRGLEKGVLVL